MCLLKNWRRTRRETENENKMQRMISIMSVSRQPTLETQIWGIKKNFTNKKPKENYTSQTPSDYSIDYCTGFQVHGMQWKKLSPASITFRFHHSYCIGNIFIEIVFTLCFALEFICLPLYRFGLLTNYAFSP